MHLYRLSTLLHRVCRRNDLLNVSDLNHEEHTPGWNEKESYSFVAADDQGQGFLVTISKIELAT